MNINNNNRLYSSLLCVLVCLVGGFGCTENIGTESSINYKELPTYAESGKLQCVIEIPAGTNHKIEYNGSNNSFEVDQANGKDRVINFLPYFGNYGFIPSTFMDPDEGGDGDALDVLVLCAHVPTKTVMEIIPLGLIKMKDLGVEDHKVIAVPADPALRTINATELNDLSPELVYIIELWLMNYKGHGDILLMGWKNEQKTYHEIEKWRLKEEEE